MSRSAGVSRQSTVGSIFGLLERLGASPYINNSVRDLDHALQTASLAQAEQASDTLVTAALLHDVGRLVIRSAVGDGAIGYEDRHEEVAAVFLSIFFGPEVTEPVRLHVAAKRYLFATDPEYRRQLSQPARESLATQGGPLNTAELYHFEGLPFASEAIRLRRWDDKAMKDRVVTPSLESFKSIVARCLVPRSDQAMVTE